MLSQVYPAIRDVLGFVELNLGGTFAKPLARAAGSSGAAFLIAAGIPESGFLNVSPF